ncbi:MAG: hypothetical protein FVQ78_05970 [Solirubrobacterales bacterium]|nr:hypothetical protein [Solirubrobacterales bacterium]
MTPASPSWGDVERFLGADGWRQIPAGERGGRRQPHIFFEKELPDGRLLQTHISHDRSSTISPGRLSTILREQLEVSRAEFWEAIRSGEPVERPVKADDEGAVEHESWVIAVLVGELHMTAEEIEKLTEQAAIDLVHRHWSRERS